MFYVSAISSSTHGSKLTRCWLAGTVSERVFKRKVKNDQITEYEIEEYCQEILRIFNDKTGLKRWHFGLHLFSHLMFGVVKLYSYQFVLFENAVYSMADTLDAFDCGIGKQSTERRAENRGAQITKISQIPIDELLMPLTPESNLHRPFRRDMNLLYEISPASHRRMIQLDESNMVRFSPLTDSQAKLWLSNDEACLWTTIDARQLPELERQPGDDEFIHPAAMEAAQPDLPTRILRTPTKRTSTQKNFGTPSKRQRQSRIPQMETLDKERTEMSAAAVPMEQNSEPPPLPVEPMVTEAPKNSMAPADPVPAILPIEEDIEPHPLPEHQVAPFDPGPAILPMEQDVEPQLLPDHHVAPADRVPTILPMEQDVEPHPIPEKQVAPIPPVDEVENATVIAAASQPVKPARRLGYRRKKKTIVDAIKTISEVKVKQHKENVQAYTEPTWKTRSVPTKKLIRTLLQLPSTVFILGVENVRYNRLRKMSDEILRRHENHICGSFSVETDSSNFRLRDLPRRRTDHELTILENVADTGKSIENGTVIQPFEVTVAPPDEVPQAEATGEFAFDMADAAELPLVDIEQTEHSVNTSDATTVTATNTGKSTENRAVIQSNKINVATPAEAPQAEAADEPAFDPTSKQSSPQLPLGNIDQKRHWENSDAITASFKRVKISTDSARSKAADRRSNSPCSDWSMHSPRSKDQVKVEKSSRSKSRSSEEFIRVNGGELSSPRSGMAANTVWTRKDLEANLEVYWHDNNIISFEQIAAPNETSDADATACFMLLLDMYKENKIILTQATTDAPIYIEKGVISDAMDWS